MIDIGFERVRQGQQLIFQIVHCVALVINEPFFEQILCLDLGLFSEFYGVLFIEAFIRKGELIPGALMDPLGELNVWR